MRDIPNTKANFGDDSNKILRTGWLTTDSGHNDHNQSTLFDAQTHGQPSSKPHGLKLVGQSGLRQSKVSLVSQQIQRQLLGVSCPELVLD